MAIMHNVNYQLQPQEILHIGDNTKTDGFASHHDIKFILVNNNNQLVDALIENL